MLLAHTPRFREQGIQTPRMELEIGSKCGLCPHLMFPLRSPLCLASWAARQPFGALTPSLNPSHRWSTARCKCLFTCQAWALPGGPLGLHTMMPRSSAGPGGRHPSPGSTTLTWTVYLLCRCCHMPQHHSQPRFSHQPNGRNNSHPLAHSLGRVTSDMRLLLSLPSLPTFI